MSGLVHLALPPVREQAPGQEDLIHRDYLQAAGLTLNADQVLRLALDALGAARVACLPFKGALFRHLLYPDPAVRIGVDQDLLVRADQFDRAIDTLRAVGFELLPFRAGRPVTGYDYHERALTHPDFGTMGCMVELHRGVSPPARYPVEMDRLFDEALDLEAFCHRVGRPCPEDHPYAPGTRFMSPEHALAHQFVHNANHNFYLPLASALDVQWIAKRWSPDWDAVVSIARRWRVSAAGYMTLRVARDCLSADIPAEVLSALAPSLPRRLWLERLIATEGVLREGTGAVPMVTFLRYGTNLRLQQALVGFPLIDGPLHAARFGAAYLHLRARDLISLLTK